MTENILPPNDAHPSVLDTPPEHPTRRSKLLNKVIGAALLVTAVAIGIMFYWATADTQVLNVKQQPFPVRTIREHPTASGVVFLTVDYCKVHDVEGELRMSFVSASREVFLPLVKERGEKKCQKVEFPVLIPKDIQPDTYKVKMRVTYNINPLKQGIVQTFESKEFTVDPTTPENTLPQGSFQGQPPAGQ
jgi:hypothetical protein